MKKLFQLFLIAFLGIVINAAAQNGTPVIDGHGTGAIPPSSAELAAMPTVDWDMLIKYAPRNVSEYKLRGTGVNSLPAPPIMDQGSQGSCVGFGYACAVSTMLFETMPSGTTYSSSVTRSPAFIYNQIKVGGCGDGSNPGDAVNLLKTKGVCAWAAMGYNQNDCSTMPNSSQLSLAVQCKAAAGSAWLSSLADIKAAIDLGYPVPACFNASAFQINSAGVVTSYSNYGANHCVCIIGYDDNTQRVKVQNSWGAYWGASGYFYVPYAIVNNNFFCGGLSVMYGLSNVTPPPPAACVAQYEPNNSTSQATAINVNTTLNAGINTTTDNDYYKIVLSSAGTLNLLLNNFSVDFEFGLYNASGALLAQSINAAGQAENISYNAAAGTYYVRVWGDGGATSTTCYALTNTFTASGTCSNAYEPNNTYSAASVINYGASIQAAIATAGDEDNYKISMPASGQVTFKLVVPAGQDLELAVYGPYNNLLSTSTNPAGVTEKVYINAGGQFCVVKVYGYNGSTGTACYTLSTIAGMASSSGIVNEGALDLQLSPNPATDKFLLQIRNTKSGEASIHIINMQGQMVQSSIAQLSDGESNVTLNRGVLPAGIYMIQVLHNGQQITRKLILE